MASLSAGIDCAAAHTLMPSVLYLSLFVSAVSLPLPSSAQAASPLCTRSESPLFACAIGARRLAVCSGTGGTIYRFGRPGRIELELRRPAFATRAYSGGGESQVVFHRNSYSYVVYDKTVRTAFGIDGRNDPATTAGLVVKRGNRIISDQRCTGSATGLAAEARLSLPPGNFVEH